MAHQYRRRPSLENLLPLAMGTWKPPNNNLPDISESEQPHPQKVAAVTPEDYSVVPCREQFRWRRLWLFYHDIRALTTSVGRLALTGMLVS